MSGIFKAYDIRGVYGKDLTDELAYRIGRAYVTFAKCRKIVVARDIRPHSEPLFQNFVKGATEQGADVIDLVTPTHYTDIIIRALSEEKLPVPVVWNSSAYEEPETLKRLEGLVDISLPDYKYSDPSLAAKLSGAADYPEKAREAIKEMYRQTGDFTLDKDGMMLGGVIIRHLVLPGFVENTLGCLDDITEMFSGENVMISLMSQYTPPEKALPVPSLNRRLTNEEYEKAVGYLYLLGWENGFVQELSSAESEFTPDFDCSGV